MTLKDVSDLRLLEGLQLLREPKDSANLSEELKLEMEDFCYSLLYLFTTLPEHLDKEINNLLRGSWIRRKLNLKRLMKRKDELVSKTAESIKNLSFVKSLEPLEDERDGYKISTIFGDGEFFLDRQIFAGERYPEFIEKGSCFGNCIHFCNIEENEGQGIKILNGICGAIAYPICHSVISVRDDYIIDFNIGIVMTKDLYLKLCRFEVLSEVTAEEIQKEFPFLVENAEIADRFGIMPAAWCLHEFIDLVKQIKNGDITDIDDTDLVF